LLVIARWEVTEDKGSSDSYYQSFRRLLGKIQTFNSSLQTTKPISLPNFPNSKNAPKQQVQQIQFPIYFPNKQKFPEKISNFPEILKFGYQSRIAIDSFTRWNSCQKKKLFSKIFTTKRKSNFGVFVFW